MRPKLLLLGLAAALPLSAHAQTAPALIPISAFVKEDQYSRPRMSPDGKHLAVTVRMPVDKRTIPMITFYSLPGLKVESVVRMPLFSVPVDYQWVSNTRLIVEKGLEVGSREKPQATGEVLAMDYDGQHQEYLYGYEALKYATRGARYGNDYGYAAPVFVPPERNDHVLLRTNLWDTEQSALYDLDTRTGVRKLVTTLNSRNAGFLVQHDGKPRFANGSNEEGYLRVWRLDDGSGKWDVVENDKALSKFTPFAFSPDNRQVYAWSAQNGGPEKVLRQDLETGEGKVIAEDAQGDIERVMLVGRQAAPLAVVSSSGRPRVTILDEGTADGQLLKGLTQQFPDHVVQLIDETDDGGKVLFSIISDRDPGAFYLYDRKANKADMLFAAMSDIEPDDMAVRRPISFKARDGLSIHGYLTLPAAKSAQKLPLILMPHGGPMSEDRWYFNPDAQFLASRGYEVLQLNFRGSTGRGERFKQAGYRQWGGKILDDLVDGVKWALSQGQFDETRVCAYGTSFGGYASLMLAAREPDMFKCAVGYAGVYDLSLLSKNYEAIGDTRTQAGIRRQVGDDAAEWARYSPVQHASEIRAAVLLIHGGKDKRAPKEQAFRMKEALEKAGHAPEWYYVDYEGHGFYDTANQTEVYQRLEAFFNKYLGKPR